MTDSPVAYKVVCRESEWQSMPCVVINEGGDMNIGYSIWSKADLDRVINELQMAGERAWPT